MLLAAAGLEADGHHHRHRRYATESRLVGLKPEQATERLREMDEIEP